MQLSVKLQSIQGDVVKGSNKVLHCVKLHLGLFLKQPCYTVALLCIILVPSVNFSQIFLLHCCVALHCIPPEFIFLVALLHCYTCSSRAFISYVFVALLCCIVLRCTCSSRVFLSYPLAEISTSSSRVFLSWAFLTYLPAALLHCVALGFNSKMSLELHGCIALVPLGHFSHIFLLHCCVALHLGFNSKMSSAFHCCIALHCTCSFEAFLTYLLIALLCCIALHLGFKSKMSLELHGCVALCSTCSSRAFLTYLPIALLCCVALHLGFNLKMSLVLHCCVALRCTCSSRAFLTYLLVALLCCIALRCTWVLTLKCP